MIYYGLEWHSLDSYFQYKELSSAPDAPPEDEIRVYAKNKSGTAALYLKDPAGSEREIGPANTVTGTGTANRLAYWSSSSVIAANAALTNTRVPFADSNGLLADSASMVWDNTNFNLTVKSNASVLRGFIAEHYQTSGQGPLFLGRRANGSIGSPSDVQTDDVLLDLNGQGYANGSFTGGRALVRFLAGQVFTSSNQGTYITLHTTPLNSTTIAERFRIGPSGQWGIGGATFGSAGQYFRSGGASAAPTWATIDHGTEITGLSDDDHTIYALLAGRSGGQTLIGGTASGNDLTLQSTSNATRGHVFFGSGQASGWDDVNLRLGIRTTAPSYPLEISGAVSEAGGLHVATTHTADGSFGLSVQPTFTPTNTGTIERGVFCFPQFNPGSSVTITRAEVLEFALRTGNGAGAITDLQGVVIGSAGYGTIKPTTVSGIYLFDIGGSGISVAQCIYMTLPTAATTNVYMHFGTGDATALGTYAGRLPVLVAGAVKYIPYYNA